MLKYATLSLAALLLISLTACAGGTAKSDARVKCAACGYEFNVDHK